MPSRINIGSKLPMQPLNLGARSGREDLVFQVTKRGLYDGSQRPNAQGCRTMTHNFSSGKEGGIGMLSVRAQYRASKAWKQCSRVQVLSSSTAVRPPAGLTGRRDMAVKGQGTSGVPYRAQVVHAHLPIWAAFLHKRVQMEKYDCRSLRAMLTMNTGYSVFM